MLHHLKLLQVGGSTPPRASKSSIFSAKLLWEKIANKSFCPILFHYDIRY